MQIWIIKDSDRWYSVRIYFQLSLNSCIVSLKDNRYFLDKLNNSHHKMDKILLISPKNQHNRLDFYFKFKENHRCIAIVSANSKRNSSSISLNNRIHKKHNSATSTSININYSLVK